jgi:hypothetical protein
VASSILVQRSLEAATDGRKNSEKVSVGNVPVAVS